MDSTGLSWPAFASCAVVLCISLCFMIFAVSGCCSRRRRRDGGDDDAAARPAAVATRPAAVWIAVAHPGGETSVGSSWKIGAGRCQLVKALAHPRASTPVLPA
jgi:hypothetical protein